MFQISNIKNRLQKAFENKFKAFSGGGKDDLIKAAKRPNMDLVKRINAQKR